MKRRSFLSTASAALFASPSQGQSNTYSLQAAPAGKMLVSPAGQTVFTYLAQKPADAPLAGNTACCFHPINTLGGERVTDFAPPDHRDHRGLFFAWHDMTFRRKEGEVKADFWGWGRFAPTQGRVIANRELTLIKADADSAEVVVRNDWMIEGQKVMDEATTVRVSEQRDARVLDIVYRFTPDGEAVLNRMAFTGFCLRCRKDGQAYFSDAKGKVTLPDSNATKPEMNWPAADWYSYTIALDTGRTVAAAVLDHPSNPKSTWHEPRPVAFLNPCVAALEPISFSASAPLALRYRVVVYDGDFSEGTLDGLARAWRATK